MGDFLKTVLPWIGAAATGNVPALITMAAKQVGEVLGVNVEATAEKIGAAVVGATPEQLTALKIAELTFKEKMQAMGFAHIEEMAKIGLQETQAYVSDTADARRANSANTQVFWLGVGILLIFGLVLVAALYGSYQLLQGGIKLSDVGIVAAVFGFLGTIVGYAAANAQQVVAYFFGSSKGSNDKGAAMAEAVRTLGAAVRK